MPQRTFRLIKIVHGHIYYTRADSATEFTSEIAPLLRSGALAAFSRTDRMRIRHSIHANKQLTIKMKCWLVGLILSYSLMLIFSKFLFLFFARQVDFVAMHQLALFIYPLSFVFLDTLHVTLGYTYANIAVYSGLCIQGLGGGLLYLMNLSKDHLHAHTTIDSHLFFLFIATSLALFCGNQCNNLLFKYTSLFRCFYTSSKPVPLWCRSLLSTAGGQCLCTFISMTCAQSTPIEPINLLWICGQNILLSSLLVPLLYSYVSFYNRHILQPSDQPQHHYHDGIKRPRTSDIQ